MSLLCLDIGTKRIGIAKSDELGIAAYPLTVIERRGLKKDFSRIIELCSEHGATKIIVGLPLDQDNRIGTSAKKVLTFVETLKAALAAAHLDIPIETWDERYSTAEAEELMIGADASRKKRRRHIDKVAAALILREYMEHKGE